MSSLLALIRRLLFACVLGWLASALVPATALAASCAPAATGGTAPADFQTYCWLDFSGYANNTATGRNGQNFSFNLADGTTVSFNLKVTGGSLSAVAVPSWTGSAFGNSAFMNIPGKPILYTTTNASTVTATLSNIVVKPPSGGTASYSMIVGDGESTNSSESLTFVTNKGAWQQVAKIPNGSSTTYPTVGGLNSTTVKETGVDGTVGSYVFRSDNNPTKITATLDAGGLQGIIIGLRYASITLATQISSMRYNAADQFSYTVATQAGKVLASGATSGTALAGAAVSVPTVAASYAFSVSESLTGGASTWSDYNVSLTCTNTNTGSTTQLPVNQPVTSYTFNSLQYGDALSCVFTNTPVFNQIVGTVYGDANHNGSQDGTEAGPGITGLYVKVAAASGGSCTSPALQAIAVDPSTGGYTIPNLPQGSYCVVLDTNNTLSDVAPALPAGWLGMQNAGGVVTVNVPLGSPTPVPQPFGIYNGSRLTGTVFADTGAGSGTANNGTQDGTEAGLASVPITASSGSTAIATATTAGDGTFTLWVPASATGIVTIVPTAPSNYLASSGGVGTTRGTYTRPGMSFTAAAGSTYTGVTFGLVPPNTLAPNGAQTAQAGTVVFYPHTFQAGSGGQVTFSLAGAPSPANPGWTAVLYQDANCNGALDSGDTPITAPSTVTANQQVCLVVKQFVPAGIAAGALNTETLTASFTYTNANPALSATLSVTDATTAGEPTALSLQKLVRNVTRNGTTGTAVTASPGETLEYTLTAQNNGNSAVGTLVINDATPAFTTYVSGTCPGTLPSGITACSVSTHPAPGATGSLQWTFTGSLAPGGQVAVTYQVQLTQ